MARNRRKRPNPFASKQVIQRERHQCDHLRPPLGENTTGLDDVLPGIMKKFGLKTEFTIERLMTDWPDILGPDSARFCRPAKLEYGALTIYVDNPVWLANLKRDSRIILAKVNEALPDQNVRRLWFALDPGD